MARTTSKTLTEAEQRVMEVLWDLPEASVRDVVDRLSEERPLAYNTVQTVLGILYRKNYVEFRREGRAHIYRAVVSRPEAQREAFDNLVTRFFGGSKNAFARYLVEEGQVDARELSRLKGLARKSRRKREPRT
ncbi:hypothetical protein ABI59_19965 [Acidobacteria bacterium Mor1]|nr:hypothetical protein ABI59_19965 [Acidobacteria bacterium Mor1]